MNSRKAPPLLRLQRRVEDNEAVRARLHPEAQRRQQVVAEAQVDAVDEADGDRTRR